MTGATMRDHKYSTDERSCIDQHATPKVKEIGDASGGGGGGGSTVGKWERRMKSDARNRRNSYLNSREVAKNCVCAKRHFFTSAYHMNRG